MLTILCVYTLQSELAQWRTLFIFTGCVHLMSSLCFVLVGINRRLPHHIDPLIRSVYPTAPTDHQVPPSDKPGVVGSGGAAPGGDEDDRSAVDSATEYGSVDESPQPISDSVAVRDPAQLSRTLNSDRDFHFGQLMESIL